MNITITSKDIPKIVNLLNGIQVKLGRAQKDIRYEVASEASLAAKRIINLARYHEGHGLAKSIKIVSHDDKMTVVGSGVEHAVWVDQGTNPHIIKPRNARFLWWEGAKSHHIRIVHHPGSKSARSTLHFGDKARKKALDKLPSIVEKHLKRVVKNG